jgi:predicted transcriptional regulator
MVQMTLFSEDNPSYLLSIRSGSAEALMSKTKPHEFRRKFENYQGHAQVFIYVTKPVGKIIGEIIFDTPIEDSIDGLCSLLTQNGFDKETSLRKYLAGCDVAYALPVVSVRQFENPISLEEVREEFGKFNPPVSYIKLDKPKYLKMRDFLRGRE